MEIVGLSMAAGVRVRDPERGARAVKSILFVCTGNIFRSMIAEYALKEELGPDAPYRISSAGTEAAPQKIVPVVQESLARRGIDPTAHRQRRLDQIIVDDSDLIIAMGLDHRDFIARNFGLQVPLFNEVSYGYFAPVLDTNEAVPDYATNPAAA